MTHLVSAELRKVTTRMLPLGMLTLAVAYLALTLVMVPVLTAVLPEDITAEQDLTSFLTNVTSPGGYVFAAQQAVGQATVFVVILVAIVVANEYSWGTLTVTFSLEPRRIRVLGGKLVALGALALAGAALLFAAGIVMIGAVQPLIPSDVASGMEGEWAPAAARSFALGLPSIVVWVCVAIALAIATRNPGAAAGIGVAISIGEGFLQLVPFVRPLLISANTQALQAVAGVDPAGGFLGTEGTIPAWRAWLALAVWATASLAVSAWLLRRRDVT